MKRNSIEILCSFFPSICAFDQFVLSLVSHFCLFEMIVWRRKKIHWPDRIQCEKTFILKKSIYCIRSRVLFIVFTVLKDKKMLLIRHTCNQYYLLSVLLMEAVNKMKWSTTLIYTTPASQSGIEKQQSIYSTKFCIHHRTVFEW